MQEKNKKYPEGYFVERWMAIGMAIFSGLGVPISIATDNPGLIGIGPGVGIAIGVAIGQSVEAKYKKEGKIRPLNEEEKIKKKKNAKMGIVILLLGILAFASIIFLSLKR